MISLDEINKMKELYNLGKSCIQISKVINLSDETVRKYLKKEGVYENKQNIYKFTDISLVTKKDLNYVLGVILSDGNVKYDTNRISITVINSDIDILNKVKKILNIDNILRISKGKYFEIVKNGITTKSYRNSQATLQFTSKELSNLLLNYNIKDDKTYNLNIPNELKNCPHFWRGMIDGDGCIYFNEKNNTYQINLVGTESVIQSFIEFVKLNNISTNSQPKKMGSIYSTAIGSGLSIKLGNLLYQDADYYLDRKFNKFQEMVNSYNSNHVDGKRIKQKIELPR